MLHRSGCRSSLELSSHCIIMRARRIKGGGGAQKVPKSYKKRTKSNLGICQLIPIRHLIITFSSQDFFFVNFFCSVNFFLYYLISKEKYLYVFNRSLFNNKSEFVCPANQEKEVIKMNEIKNIILNYLTH